MFLNAEPFFGIVASYRLCWIGGRVGGHKTSLAYAIAEQFLNRGYRLISNNRSVWADDPRTVRLDDNGMLRAVVLLDEGGLSFKSSRQVEMIASYPAKMDIIYLIPSFWPPTRAAQVLVCQPLFNFKSAGIPLVLYKWRVKIGGMEDQGKFLWWNPASIYGIYSRQDPGDTASEIIEYLVEKTGEFRKHYERSDRLSTLEENQGPFDQLIDAAENMAEAADQLSTIPVRKRRKW